MDFAEKLKMIRTEKKLTQEQLADMLSVSRQAVSKWESGAGYPETEKLLQLSKELNVSLDYLLLDENSLKEKRSEEPNTTAYAMSERIAIPSYDKKCVVRCISVKSNVIIAPKKNEPKYILYGVDKVTFWGEHTTILGWYDSLENIQKEIEEITKAISEGKSTYELKYYTDIEVKGIFQQPKVKKL